jgi:hypothetical protein
MKYSKEQEEVLHRAYTESPNKETVSMLAEKLGVTTRSIVGKLSRMGIYQKVAYAPKYADKPISKEEIVSHIIGELEMDEDFVVGLSKSQKPALLALEEALVAKGYIKPRDY